jgi:hypothetical protein
VSDWQDLLREHAARNGWTIDATQDLARLMRLPGTMNRKADRVAVTADLPGTVRRYDPAELRDALAAAKRLSPAAAMFLAEVPDRPSLQTTEPTHSQLTDDQLIERASTAKHGDRFVRLFVNGDTSGYKSPSEADEALTNDLGYWTDYDRDRMDTLFRRSALFRKKWDVKHHADGRTYGEGTIDKTLAGRDFHSSNNGRATDTASSPTEKSETPPDGLPSHTLGTLTLHPEYPRPTNTRVSVAVSIADASGRTIGRLSFTDSANGQREAVKGLLRFALDADPAPVVTQILAQAAAAADQEQVKPKGQTIAEIIEQNVPPCFDLVFRCTRGAYSNRIGAEITATDFCKFVPAWLQRLCEKTVDCPRKENCEVNRLAIFRNMQPELGGLWAGIVEKLPTEDAANVGPTSPAAKRFKAIMIETLSDPVQFEVEKTAFGTRASSGTVYAPSSLAVSAGASAGMTGTCLPCSLCVVPQATCSNPASLIPLSARSSGNSA